MCYGKLPFLHLQFFRSRTPLIFQIGVNSPVIRIIFFPHYILRLLLVWNSRIEYPTITGR